MNARLMATVAGLSFSVIPSHSGEVDFSSRIQPLFAERCLECHGADKQKGDLRLDNAESVRRSLDREDLIARVTSEDPEKRMPPKGPRLGPEEVAALRQWIAEGARFQQHWAYAPLRQPTPPAVRDVNWVQSPIDRFVLARLEKEGIAPSPPASRPVLIKRLHYDLIGLPPTPEEVDAFVNDPAPDAYAKLADRLLASPHFGERWGRHWLDAARYADSDGYEKDNSRPLAWHFRDWVIKAINRDLPVDQFTIEQLAGDLLPGAAAEQKIATAFHRQTLTNTEGGVDQEEFRNEAVFDRTETTATIWLGLTMNCARCHSHKYDSIQQKEYYQLFDFFNNGDESTFHLPVPEETMKAYREAKEKHAAKEKDLASRLKKAREDAAEACGSWLAAQPIAAEDLGNHPEPIRKLLSKDRQSLSEKEQMMLMDHFLNNLHEPLRQLREEQLKLAKAAPKEPIQAFGVITQRAQPRETRLLERGSFLSPGEKVSPGGPSVLPPIQGRHRERLDRLDLARWLMAEENPLPPRVLANQVWEKLFGQGLVRTMNDFGVRGERPDHPELLDWLGSEFRRLGWSRKALIRAIVLSSVYQQASVHREDLADRDPNNHLLARQNRFRVEAEIIRDLCLSIAGLLSPKIGGPSVFPPMPPEIAALSYANNFKWTNSQGEDRYRRGMYTYFKRTAPHPNLTTFDCPDSNTASVKRNASNTPLQALTMLNNEVFVEAARAFAVRLSQLPAADERERVTDALRRCVARVPATEEVDRFLALWNESRQWYQKNPESSRELTGKNEPDPSLAAWVTVARVALNLDELITRE